MNGWGVIRIINNFDFQQFAARLPAGIQVQPVTQGQVPVPLAPGPVPAPVAPGLVQAPVVG